MQENASEVTFRTDFQSGTPIGYESLRLRSHKHRLIQT